MEAIETAAMLALVAVLGPAIRRFGRNYAQDLWPATPATASASLRLLDLAYHLVFIGFVLLTVDLPGERVVLVDLGDQLADAGTRIGALVLIMGVLHATTIAVLPLVALVSNSTQTGRSLPRWVVVLFVVGAGVAAWQALGLLAILGMG